jgi:alkylation response protein AidB-like acyl-CoA dehydrogenase
MVPQFAAGSNHDPGGAMDTTDLSSRIQELLPAIRTRRREFEQARRMPRDLVEDLRKTGIFSLTVPRVIGGKEARPVDIMQAIETVAIADGYGGASCHIWQRASYAN